MEQLHNGAATIDVFAVLYPQLQGIDLRTQASRLKVPVFLVQGRVRGTRTRRARPAVVHGPRRTTKKMITFDTSGHRPLFEQPALFATVMADTVLAGTRPEG